MDPMENLKKRFILQHLIMSMISSLLHLDQFQGGGKALLAPPHHAKAYSSLIAILSI